MKHLSVAALTIGAAAALAWNGPTYAQTNQAGTDQAATTAGRGTDELEEVIVTAERRTADVQKTAASVSVRSGDELKREGRYTLGQILEDVPGVVDNALLAAGIGGSDNQGGGVIIRGTVPNGGAPGSNISGVPATAVYADGIYEGIGGDYDVDRVEVLRGPQGTLYGRSATGGVVSTYTRNPALNSFNVDVAEELGSYALRHETAAINLPLGDTLALRAAGNEYDRDGYFSAAGGKTETTEGRAKLLYQPSSDFSVLVAAALQYNHTNTGGVVIDQPTPNAYLFVPAAIGPGENHFHQYWGDLNWNFGPATLTYIPALRDWQQNALIIGAGPGGGFINQTLDRPFDQFVTQELRLASNPGSKLSWQVGTLYYDNRLHDSNAVNLIPPGGLIFSAVTSKETKDWGAFGEATYPFTDAVRLTAGARYDYTYVQTTETYTLNFLPGEEPQDLSSLNIGGPAGTRRFYNGTYKLRLETDVTPTNLLYANVSTGFLPGDVTLSTASNTAPGAPPGSVVGAIYPYKEETLTAYELGSKNRFLNNSLQLNGDVYYYDYGGYQTFINTSTNPTSPSFATVAVPAKMRGLELEAIYQLTPDDRISLNYAYIHAEFFDVPPLYAEFVAETRITGIAPVTGSASYDHTFHLPGGSTLDFHGDARYASGHDTGTLLPSQYAAGEEPWVFVGGEWVSDLNLTWASQNGKYSASGYVRNVGNNQYKVTGGAPNLPQPGTASLYDPRTLGVVLNAHF